jgi:hypothetical protein
MKPGDKRIKDNLSSASSQLSVGKEVSNVRCLFRSGFL